MYRAERVNLTLTRVRTLKPTGKKIEKIFWDDSAGGLELKRKRDARHLYSGGVVDR